MDIKGYRTLSQYETDQINQIKTLAEGVGRVVEHIGGPSSEADMRWVAIARTQLQQGFMALTRAVAKPTTF